MESFEQILTTAMISVMSFFGWNFDEYKHVLPDTIAKIGETIDQAADNLQILDVVMPIPTVSEKLPEQKPILIKKTPPQKPVETSKPVVTPVTPSPPVTVPKSEPAPLPKETVTTPENKNITTEQKVKSATGNIFCTIIEAGRVRKITGSAVAISNNGVILTNAHVAEYLLLENTGVQKNITCFVRTGSPAVRAYKASVVYLPKAWVTANKDNMKYATLSGTGENDYALIVLNEKVTGSSASNLSFIEGNTRDVSLDTGIYLSGYPAFGGNIIENALYSVVEKSEIKDVWRLNQTPSDLMGTAPTILATHGSSGGAAASLEGKLLGIMVATTADTYTGKPNMRLISFGYISEDIQSKTGKSLNSFIKNADSESVQFIASDGKQLAETLYSNSR